MDKNHEVFDDYVMKFDFGEDKIKYKYNHSYRREFCFLFLHGVLHCLGYDHIEENDRIVMEEMQTKILNKCKITRD